MSYFNNPTFGIGTGGIFDTVGGNLSKSPFGGPALNVGGFTGQTPQYGGGGLGMNQAAGMLGLANLGLGMMGMSNTANSLQGAYDTAAALADSELGKNLFAQNKDIFEQKDAARWASKFKANDPFYRQTAMYENLPDLAGKYGRFGAFVA